MSARANFVKSELEEIYNNLNASYEYANILRLENHSKFWKIIALIVQLTEKSNNLRQVFRSNFV